MSTPPNPNYSDLDPHQIFQRSFDESIDRLRVDAVASIDPGSMEVVITHVDDSIRIGDGTDIMLVNPDGSINVNVSSFGSSGTEVIQYSEVIGVAAAIETTIITYTVPVAKTFYLHNITVSGSNIGEYKVKINGTTKNKKRTWWTKFNEDFNFLASPNQGLSLTAGQTVQVTILHNSSSVGDFNSSIQGLEV